MLRLTFYITAITCLNLSGCGTFQPKGPTYDEAVQVCETEQRIYDRLDKLADDLIIQDTCSTMARIERDSADRRRTDPNQSEAEYEKKLKEIEAKSAKERADEMLNFKERLSKAKAARDAQTVKLDAAKKVVDELSKSK